MTRFRYGLALAVIVTLIWASPSAGDVAQTADAAAGTWRGPIALPTGPLPVAVTLGREGATGAWSGTIDIPAQGARMLKLTGVTIDDRTLRFAIAGVPGSPAFSGTLSADGTVMTGTFTQGGASFPFELRRDTRPQEPKPPFPYRQEQVSYRNESAGIGLAGTLTLPTASGPFSAVVLISGSGPQDRDETIEGHKPFLLIADTLTRRGVAVLRVDDRGVGGTDRGPAGPTTLDFAGDVRAGVAFLKSRGDIDPARVGLIGHSEGANIAAIVAADSTDVHFIVMLAGAGVRGDLGLVLQAEALGRLSGMPAPLVQWDKDLRQRIYAIVKAETNGAPNTTARQALLDSVTAPPGADVSAARATAQAILQAASTPWFRQFLAYDPGPTIARVRCPVLVLNGERDRQVVPTENLAAIRAALQSGANGDATVRELPGLNHLFQTGVTGLPAEYGAIPETFAPAALTMVADWVSGHTR